MKLLSAIFSYTIIFLVKIYQWLLSPLYPSTCRFNPTCSNYMIEAIKEWGTTKGIYLGSKRIARCHPWGEFGDDPVPRKKKG